MDQEQNTPQSPQAMIVKSRKNVGLAGLRDLGVHGGKKVQRGAVRGTRLMHVSLTFYGIML